MDSAVTQKTHDFFSPYPIKKYDDKEIIIYAGDDPRGVYFLLSGQVKQYDISSRGAEVVVNMFKPPAFFPMTWAINKTPNTYFFASHNSTTLKVAPAQDALNFIQANNDVLYDLLRRIFLGAEGVQRRMVHMMSGTAKTRVLFELILCCQRFGEVKPDGSCKILLYETELACRVGISRETTSRELNKLKQAGLLNMTRKYIFIKDLSNLEKELLKDL